MQIIKNLVLLPLLGFLLLPNNLLEHRIQKSIEPSFALSWFCAAQMEAEKFKAFYCEPGFVQFVFQPGVDKAQAIKDKFILKGYALYYKGGVYSWKTVPMIKITDKKLALKRQDDLFLGNLMLTKKDLEGNYDCAKPATFTDLYFIPIPSNIDGAYVAYRVTDKRQKPGKDEILKYDKIVQPSPPAGL